MAFNQLQIAWNTAKLQEIVPLVSGPHQLPYFLSYIGGHGNFLVIHNPLFYYKSIFCVAEKKHTVFEQLKGK